MTRTSARVRNTRYASLNEADITRAINATAEQRLAVAPRPVKGAVNAKAKGKQPKRAPKAPTPAPKRPVTKSAKETKRTKTPEPKSESSIASRTNTPGSAQGAETTALDDASTIDVERLGGVKPHVKSATPKPAPRRLATKSAANGGTRSAVNVKTTEPAKAKHATMTTKGGRVTKATGKASPKPKTSTKANFGPKLTAARPASPELGDYAGDGRGGDAESGTRAQVDVSDIEDDESQEGDDETGDVKEYDSDPDR